MDIRNSHGELLGGWHLVSDSDIERPRVNTSLNQARTFHEESKIEWSVSARTGKDVFTLWKPPRRDGCSEQHHLYIEPFLKTALGPWPHGRAIVCHIPMALDLLKTDPRFFEIEDKTPHAVQVIFKNAAGSPTTLVVVRHGWSGDGSGGRRLATDIETLVIPDGEPITAEQARKAAEVMLRIKTEEPASGVLMANRERSYLLRPTVFTQPSIIKGWSP